MPSKKLKIEFYSSVPELLRVTLGPGPKKPAVYLSFHPPEPKATARETLANEVAQVKRDCRFMRRLSKADQQELVAGLLYEGWAVIFCESAADRDLIFKETDGDDTDGNVYALTFTADGTTLNENT